MSDAEVPPEVPPELPSGHDRPDPLPAMLLRAQALLDTRRPEEAIALLGQAVAAHPGDARTLGLLSLAYLQSGDPGHALKTADEAAAASPTNPWPHRLRASALIKLGNASAALAAARQSVALAPYAVESHLMAGEALIACGQLTEARAAAEYARGLDPHRAEPSVLLSVVALRSRRWSEAEGHARAALAIDPENTAALNNLGLALRNLGKRREAVHYLGAASKLDPKNPLYHRNAVATAGGYIGLAVVAGLELAYFLLGGAGIATSIAGAAAVLVVFSLIYHRGALWRELANRLRGRAADGPDPQATPELMRQLRRAGWRIPSRAERAELRRRRLPRPPAAAETVMRWVGIVLASAFGVACLAAAVAHGHSPSLGGRVALGMTAAVLFATAFLAARAILRTSRRKPGAG